MVRQHNECSIGVILIRKIHCIPKHLEERTTMETFIVHADKQESGE